MRFCRGLYWPEAGTREAPSNARSCDDTVEKLKKELTAKSRGVPVGGGYWRSDAL
jgi:hypothetical protein